MKIVKQRRAMAVKIFTLYKDCDTELVLSGCVHVLGQQDIVNFALYP